MLAAAHSTLLLQVAHYWASTELSNSYMLQYAAGQALPSACSNFGWWMDWLDALSVSPGISHAADLEGDCRVVQLSR
jgi:hypothetical protein